MSTVFRVEKTANYTVMSNYHLKDRRLSYKAKGLLSEMLSLPPDWDYTLSGLAVIANDGVDSVRSAVRELERYGYLVRYQRRDKRGRMSVNEYAVYENPGQNPEYIPTNDNEENPHTEKTVKQLKNGSVKPISPLLENPVTDEKSGENPKFFDDPLPQKSSPKRPLSENPTTVSYHKLNTQELNIHQFNQSLNRADAWEDRTDRINAAELKKRTDEHGYYRELIRENIEYDFLYRNRNDPKLKIDIGKVDEIVSIMVKVVCSRRKTIRVNGEELPQVIVKQRFLELNHDHIEYVITALDRSAGEIYNIRAYLITALYNAPDTMESCYNAWVKRDLYGEKEK